MRISDKEHLDLQRPDLHRFWCNECKSHIRFFHKRLEMDYESHHPELTTVYICDECNKKIFKPSEAWKAFCYRSFFLILCIGLISSALFVLCRSFFSVWTTLVTQLVFWAIIIFFLKKNYRKEYGLWEDWANKRGWKKPALEKICDVWTYVAPWLVGAVVIIMFIGHIVETNIRKAEPNRPRIEAKRIKAQKDRNLIEIGKRLQAHGLTKDGNDPETFKRSSNLGKIRYLNLEGTRITDRDLKDVAELKQLEMLSLRGTQISGLGLKELINLENLKELNISSTNISDESINEVVKMRQLEGLGLGDTKITDISLRHIAKLKNLKMLYLTGTKVTGAGVAELQKALPNCEIYGP